ncbi:MAG TPA: HhH-GPD-type base excision DNA repair protein [Acidimicrobiales bacterium]|nr:HhH-GPD-type base excision DNA repair protein [Acidimicrobiales bacterium]
MLHLSQDRDADEFLTGNWLALLIGMVLDQQVTIEKAFSSPAELSRRLGAPLDAASIAAMSLEDLTELFRERPALHRYPGSMAKRVQDVCRVVATDYGGKVENIWAGVTDGDELVGRLDALPGFGLQKSKIFAALLGKQLGVHPQGWEKATTPYGDVDAFLSVADITSHESLEKVRANKRAMKAKARAKG